VSQVALVGHPPGAKPALIDERPTHRPIRTLTAGTLVAFAFTPSCGSTGNSPGSADGDAGSLVPGSADGSGGGGGSGALVPGEDGAVPETCTAIGATRSCCSNGIQTCTGIEFGTWGPCVDTSGAPVSCHGAGCDSPSGCDAAVDVSSPPTPPPPPTGSPTPPPPPAACSDQSLNNEPEILVGYSPAMGQTVGSTGQIKVWVSDENSPFIAPMEQVDNTTGAITTPGDRTATASDGLLFEPALYLAPQSPTNGGTPYFPQWIKGAYNNNPPARGTFTGGAPIDPPPSGSSRLLQYTGEFIWDVGVLGIGPGSYTAVFSVHDGDRDRAIGCVSIVVTH